MKRLDVLGTLAALLGGGAVAAVAAVPGAVEAAAEAPRPKPIPNARLDALQRQFYRLKERLKGHDVMGVFRGRKPPMQCEAVTDAQRRYGFSSLRSKHEGEVITEDPTAAFLADHPKPTSAKKIRKSWEKRDWPVEREHVKRGLRRKRKK